MKTRLSLTKTVDLTFGRLQTPIEIRTTHLLKRLWLRFTATFTVTGGTGAGTLFSDSLYRLFQMLLVNAGGKPQMVLTGQTLFFLMTALQIKAPAQTLPASLAAGTSTSVELWLKIPYGLDHSFDPVSTALPSWLWARNPPTLSILTAAAGAVADGEDGVIGFTAPRLDVWEEQILDENPDPYIRDYVEFTQLEENVSAAVTKGQKIYIPCETGQEIVRVLVETFDATGKDIYTSTIVTHLGMTVAGQPVQEQEEFGVLQQTNVEDYNLSAKLAGLVILDAASDKGTDYGEIWYVGQGDRPYIEFRCSAACKLRVTACLVTRRPYSQMGL